MCFVFMFFPFSPTGWNRRTTSKGLSKCGALSHAQLPDECRGESEHSRGACNGLRMKLCLHGTQSESHLRAKKKDMLVCTFVCRISAVFMTKRCMIASDDIHNKIVNHESAYVCVYVCRRRVNTSIYRGERVG